MDLTDTESVDLLPIIGARFFFFFFCGAGSGGSGVKGSLLGLLLVPSSVSISRVTAEHQITVKQQPSGQRGSGGPGASYLLHLHPGPPFLTSFSCSSLWALCSSCVFTAVGFYPGRFFKV